MSNKLKFIPIVLAILILVVEVIALIAGFNITIGFEIAIVFLVLHIAIREYELYRISNSRPNPVFSKTIVRPHPMTEFRHRDSFGTNLFMGTATVTETYIAPLREVAATADYIQNTEPYSIGFVVVENQKLGKREVTTSLNTHAKMWFYKENMVSIHEGIDARWSDTVEPSYNWLSPKEQIYYLQKDIPAGVTHELCMVAKQLNDDDCFIFNLETYSESKLRRKEAILGKGNIYVKIVLSNANSMNDVMQWFELNNQGSGFDIILSMIPMPPKGRN